MVSRDPPGGVLRAAFVGREHEYAQLRSSLAAAGEGRGALALLAGEPGIGKTRLAEELAAEARRLGMLSLGGRCDEMQGAPAYTPFLDLIESVLH